MSLLLAMLLLQSSASTPANDAGGREIDAAEVTPESRAATLAFASCAVDRSADKVRDLLTRDFTTSSYESGLKNVARANEDCFRVIGRSGRLGMEGLSFAAALAESMLERDETPLNVRLAHVAAGKEAPAYSPSDKAAMCVARSAPDETARLFATEVATPDETAAAAALAPVLAACARAVGSPPIEADAFGLRAIVATAAYRLLAAQEAAK